MRRSGDDYAEALAGLLPTGSAWSREPASPLMTFVSGLAQVWASPDARAADLLEIETDPRRTYELLAEWERAFGLPEGITRFAPQQTFSPFAFGVSSFGGKRGRIVAPVIRYGWTIAGYVPAPTQGLDDRRGALVEKIVRGGGQSRPFFEAAAAALGYSITIREFGPFQFGLSSFGGRRGQVYPPSARFYWSVAVHGPRITRFRFGASSFGHDRIMTLAKAEDLESLFRRLKPAHTDVIFKYDGAVQPQVERFEFGASSFGNDPILKLAA